MNFLLRNSTQKLKNVEDGTLQELTIGDSDPLQPRGRTSPGSVVDDKVLDVETDPLMIMSRPERRYIGWFEGSEWA